MNWLDQMVLCIDPVEGDPSERFEGDSSEPYSLQKGAGNCRPSTDACGEYMRTYDILRKMLCSDLGYEYFED